MRAWLFAVVWSSSAALALLGVGCTREVIREIVVQPTAEPTSTATTLHATSTVEACTERDAVARIEPSVVRIEGSYWGGSGVVIDELGYVLTNRHIVEGDRSVTVVLPDRRRLSGEVWSVAADADLALVKVSGTALHSAEWGDSADLRPPDRLIAVGYPMADVLGELGEEPSVTTGTFSAHRSDGQVKWLQTDAPLNPGSSGGAVVDTCGRLVGIATAGLRDTEGMNLAIASETARRVADEMIRRPAPSLALAQSDARLTPEDTTHLYYYMVANRDFPEAYLLLSQRFQTGHPYNKWLAGYDTTLFVSVEDVRTVQSVPPIVHVSVVATDLFGRELVTRRFAGEWTLVWERDAWRLDVGKIQVVP